MEALPSYQTKSSPAERSFLTYWRLFAKGESEPLCGELGGELMFARSLGRRFRFDFAWPAYRLAVEIDGGQWKTAGGRHARDTDREKMNLAAILGWRVMHFSPQMLEHDPEKCIRQVVSALEIP